MHSQKLSVDKMLTVETGNRRPDGYPRNKALERSAYIMKMKNIIFVMMFLALSILLHGANLWAAHEDDAVMDRDDKEYTARTGTWGSSVFLPCAIGGGYQYAFGTGETMTIDTEESADITGWYAVYARWTAHANRNNAAVYSIYDGTTLRQSVTVDQRSRGCGWNYLDTVTLTKGNKGRVIISNPGATSGEATISDGIRFVRVQSDRTFITDEAGVEFAGGDQFLTLTSADMVVRTVALTAPSAGYVMVDVSGSFFFGNSSTTDYVHCSITTGNSVLLTNDFGSQEHTADAMRRVPFAATRGFSVGAGTTTFKLICSEGATSQANVVDSNMKAVFYPSRY